MRVRVRFRGKYKPQWQEDRGRNRRDIRCVRKCKSVSGNPKQKEKPRRQRRGGECCNENPDGLCVIKEVFIRFTEASLLRRAWLRDRKQITDKRWDLFQWLKSSMLWDIFEVVFSFSATLHFYSTINILNFYIYLTAKMSSNFSQTTFQWFATFSRPQWSEISLYNMLMILMHFSRNLNGMIFFLSLLLPQQKIEILVSSTSYFHIIC